MDRKSDSISISVRDDNCCNRHWDCLFSVGFILLTVLGFTFLMWSSDLGPILEANWQKHWSETQNMAAGSKLVFEPADNVVMARDEFVEPYDEMVSKQDQENPASLGIMPHIYDFSLRKNFSFIFNTSVNESIVFDDNYLNPCWAETIPKLLYENNFYKNDKDLMPILDASFTFMRQLFLKRSDASNHWRLRCLPYFYIMEAPPTATPRLYNALRFHPSIYNPEVAEPEFWNDNGPGGRATLRDFLDLFDTASENIRNSTSPGMTNGATVLKHKHITGDGTSSYLWKLNSWRRIVGNQGELEPKTTAATMIKRFTPNAKIIMVLRNPTERLFQDYLQQTDYPSGADFHDKAVKALTALSECEKRRSVRACVYDTFLNQRQLVRLRIGMYYPFVKDWIDVFGRQQVKVIRHEDYLSNPSEIISNVCSFLGIPPYNTKDLESMEFMVKDTERKRKEKEKLKMLSRTRRMLEEYHKTLNRQLADLLADDKFTWPDMADDSNPLRPQALPSDSQQNIAYEKNPQQEQQERERQERESQDRERQDRERQTTEQQQRDQQQREQQLRQQSEELKKFQKQKEQQLREDLQRIQQSQQQEQQRLQFQAQQNQQLQQGQQAQQQVQQIQQQGQAQQQEQRAA